MGNCTSYCNKPEPKPKMITIQKRNKIKTKEEIRAELLEQLAYMKEKIDNMKSDSKNQL
jgi:hypothetical protein